MTREEFEVWISDSSNIEEALDRLPKADRPIEKWLKLFAVNLLDVAKEEEKNDEDEEGDDTFSEDLDDDLHDEDDDEESEETSDDD